MSVYSEFKVCVIGDSGVGKTTWIEMLKKLPYRKEYEQTHGMTENSITLKLKGKTGIQTVVFNLLDIGENCGLNDGYYIGSDACIIIHRNGRKIQKWKNDFKRTVQKSPILFVKNTTSEVPLGKVQISCRKNKNIFVPLIFLSRFLLKDSSLVLAR